MQDTSLSAFHTAGGYILEAKSYLILRSQHTCCTEAQGCEQDLEIFQHWPKFSVFEPRQLYEGITGSLMATMKV